MNVTHEVIDHHLDEIEAGRRTTSTVPGRYAPIHEFRQPDARPERKQAEPGRIDAGILVTTRG